MLIELILALFVGIIVGTFTGLLPGIHINLVIAFILGFSIFSDSLSLPIAIFITSISFTHILIDFIPTTLLGIPTEENYLSAQPAHKLVMQGKAREAILIAFRGVIFSIFPIMFLFPIYVFFLPAFYEILENIIPYILLCITLFLVFRERIVINGLIIFSISGILGYLAFNLPVKEPLLPLLSGLFGISSIFSGMFENNKIPKQKFSKFKFKIKRFIKTGIASTIISPIFSFFPGIGAGHISMICSQIIQTSSRQFIFLNSFSSSINMALSIMAAYSISKTRTGSSAAILELLKPFEMLNLVIIVFCIIISILLAYYIGNKILIGLIYLYNLIPYQKFSIFTIIFIVLINFIFSNSLGIVILACGTAIGIVCQRLQVRKIQMMGSLLISTLLYYLV